MSANEGVAQQLATQMQTASGVVNHAAKTIVISNDGEYDAAAKLLLDIRARHKAVEDKRKEFVTPLNTTVKNINTFFKQPLADYKAAELSLKQAMARYFDNKEQARRKALVDAQAAAQQQEKSVFMEKMSNAADNLPPEAAGTHTRSVNRFEIVDASLVPRHYCSPDDRKIKAAIEALDDKTAIAIPGVRVWKETLVVAHGLRGVK